MTQTVLQAAVTKTASDAPFNGTGVDISGITGDFDLVVRVNSLTAEKKAKLIVSDSVDNFSTSRVVAIVDVQGGLDASVGGKVYSFKRRDIPSARFGTGSAKLRISLEVADSAASINYQAWIES